jgi:hypothetical protein
VVSIGQDGTVRSHDNENEPSVASEPERFPRTVIEEAKPAIRKESSTDGKLVVAEEIAKGHVTWKSVKLYLSGLGGDYPFMFFSIWISASFLTDWMDTLSSLDTGVLNKKLMHLLKSMHCRKASSIFELAHLLTTSTK